MKRSEMLSKIDNYLISRGFRKSGSFDVAWAILQIVEEHGMLPPRRKAKSWADMGIESDETDYESPEFFINTWESEDV